jgi:hypothetical protein
MSNPRAARRSIPRCEQPVEDNACSNSDAPAAGYVRARDLPKLVPLWPSEIEALSRAEHARLLAKLRRALRAERQRGLGGHWAYDLARHAQLLRAYRAETAAYLLTVPATASSR